METGQDGGRSILVSGDVVIDNHLYLGDRKSPDATGRGVSAVHVWGGASLACEVLQSCSRLVAPSDSPFTVEFGLALPHRPCIYASADSGPRPDTLPGLHCYATWELMRQNRESKSRVWRANAVLGYGGTEGVFCDFAPLRHEPEASPNVILLDDAALGFRFKLDGNAEDAEAYKESNGVNDHYAWPSILERDDPLPEWIICKMARPFCRGDLWQTLARDRNARRLILVVSASDLRQSGARISTSSSWERTAADTTRELLTNPAFQPLLRCAHLIVAFRSEGALWIEHASSPDQREIHLLLDPKHQEGEWPGSDSPGRVLGHLSCLTSSLAAQILLNTQDAPEFVYGDVSKVSELHRRIEQGIECGLHAMRVLHLAGHGPEMVKTGKVWKACIPGFPFNEVAQSIISHTKGTYCEVRVPETIASDPVAAEQWSILADSEYEGTGVRWPLLGTGLRVALYGVNELRQVPQASYGRFLTADRGEIEALQNLRQVIEQYVSEKTPKRPLSIAVFGPPGAGKSYAVKQLARQLLGERAEMLTFNLSQFAGQDDLVGAFHQVRDLVLKGSVPIVFWDEFDTDDLTWLKSFLAPMQDGEFSEGQSIHYIGPCVFVFAGGTRESLEAFTSRNDNCRGPEGKTERDLFIQKKGPDFVSRLSGYLNVRGPNPQPIPLRDGTRVEDLCYPVRRATALRSMLGLDPAERLEIDHDVLAALLATKRYRNGSRSLEKLATYLRSASPGSVTQSNLPPREILGMYVEDVDDFLCYLNRSSAFRKAATGLAAGIHEAYLLAEKSAGRNADVTWNLPFEALPAHVKQDNMAAAERICEILGLIGLAAVPAAAETQQHVVPPMVVESLLRRHCETLAMREHEGWLKGKRFSGYRQGDERDEATRHHEAMLPYRELSDDDIRRDRQNVLNIPRSVANAGYVIVPMSSIS